MDRTKVVRSPAPLRMQVVRLLREAILVGDFTPGDRLVEATLCERFDVSRSVIREAIRQLESEGLVTTLAQRGPIVTKLSRDDAVALYEVRAALEGLAGACFAERASDEHKQQLRAALDQLTRAVEHGNEISSLQAKDDFYDVLLEGAGNPIITSTLRAIHARVQLLRGRSMQTPGRPEESIAELRAIVEAADDGDADRTRHACENHVMRAQAAALPMLAGDHAGEAIS